MSEEIIPWYTRGSKCCYCRQEVILPPDVFGYFTTVPPYLDKRPVRQICEICRNDPIKYGLIQAVDGITFSHLPVVIPKQWRDCKELCFSYNDGEIKKETKQGNTQVHWNDKKQERWLTFHSELCLKVQCLDGYVSIGISELEAENPQLPPFKFNFLRHDLTLNMVSEKLVRTESHTLELLTPYYDASLKFEPIEPQPPQESD